MLRRLRERRLPLLRLVDYLWRFTAILTCLLVIRFLNGIEVQQDRIATALIRQGSRLRETIDIHGETMNERLARIEQGERVFISRVDSQFSHQRIEQHHEAVTAQVTAKQESKKIQDVLTDTLQPQAEAVEKMANKVADAAAKPDEKPNVVITPAPVTVLPPAAAAAKPTEPVKAPPPERGKWGGFWHKVFFLKD